MSNPKWTTSPDSSGIWWRAKSKKDWDIGEPVKVRKIERWGMTGHRVYLEVEHEVAIIDGEHFWFGPFIVSRPDQVKVPT